VQLPHRAIAEIFLFLSQ